MVKRARGTWPDRVFGSGRGRIASYMTGKRAERWEVTGPGNVDSRPDRCSPPFSFVSRLSLASLCSPDFARLPSYIQPFSPFLPECPTPSRCHVSTVYLSRRFAALPSSSSTASLLPCERRLLCSNSSSLSSCFPVSAVMASYLLSQLNALSHSKQAQVVLFSSTAIALYGYDQVRMLRPPFGSRPSAGMKNM